MCKGFIRVLCCLIIIMLNINIDVNAQQINDLNSFKVRNINDGLSQISVESIFQDSSGYVWIGTRDGLNRYNGHKIKIYRKNKKMENSLSGNAITSINEDKSGNIWVGTTTGLNKIDVSTNKITRYLPNENGCNISHYRIRDILIGEDGEILVATNNGLNIYNEDKDDFVRIYGQGYEKGELSGQAINALEQDRYGNYWVGTKEGLNKIDKINGEVIEYLYDHNNNNSISGNYISSLYYDDNNQELWVGTCYLGLNRINLNNGVIERFFSGNESTDLPGAYIKDILKNSSGEVWVATDYGLAYYDEKNNIFNRKESDKYDFSNVVSNDINTVFEDNSGMMWVGTPGGISTYNKINEFKSYRTSELNTNSVTEQYISGIYEDNDGLLWVGTMLDGIDVIDRESGQVKKINHKSYNKEEISISNDMVREITGIDNEIWIATQHGLDLYNKATDTLVSFKESHGLASNDILSLLIDSDGVLWIGTYGGICSYDRNGNIINYSKQLLDSGITQSPIVDIHQDKDGDIWFAADIDNGLIRYTNGKFEKYNLSGYKKFYSRVYSINSDDSYIWLGTDSGLVKLNKDTNDIILYNEEDGMNNSFVYGMLFDEDNNLWLSTNYGISKFDIKEDKFINFNVDDGLQSNEFNQYSYYKSRSGEMFFGGINGFTSFYPRDIEVKSYIPQVQIGEFISGDNTLYEKENNTINLNYNENMIEFEFFLPDYSSSNLQYFYMLEGIDNKWINAGSRNYANYINIEPGKYVFKVCARNAKGDFSEPTCINVIVDPPIYKTTLAYFIYFAISICIIFIIWNRVKILDGLVAQKTVELNKKLVENEELYKRLLANEKYKNNYFVNLSHELRTPLNIIVSAQHVVDNLNKREEGISREKISHYMNTIKRNSNRLIRLIDNIINTSKIESGSYKLNIEECDIVYLVEELALSMKDYIEEQGIELIIDPDIEEKIIQCDSSEIEKVIMNLISNAVKFTKRGGVIEVRVSECNECVKVSVKDTGIGIDRSKYKSIFNRFDQAYNSTSEEFGGSGLGLTLSKQLIELHGGTIDISSEIGKGSEFIVILPVKQKNEDIIEYRK
ncbi:sensor histidine kinase [Clostridium sp. D53t1_180928_C8]|uniref:ligand-binding sensor domain-containing protein n=1 Tax=Clostridium sp. D53t1_180928_C8 TaxID=2787101 RepID=UPI0018ABF614|nr:sensor histidine kinase [Clostridium sp. D53t1_180928_C8]